MQLIALLFAGYIMAVKRPEIFKIATLSRVIVFTVFQKKTPSYIIGYKLRNSCCILIILDTKIPHII